MAETIESCDVPEITPPTISSCFSRNCNRFKSDINKYVIKAQNILKGNFLDCYTSKSLDNYIKFIKNFEFLILDPVAGSGTIWINYAQKYPKIGVVAVEKRFKRAVRLYEKAQKLRLQNIFIFRAPFEEIYPILKFARFDFVYIAFPDPWPREKWEKHRIYLSTDKFKSLLKCSGRIIIKTDNVSIAKYSVKYLLENNFVIYKYLIPYIEPLKPFRTDFEKLFLKKDTPIFCIVAKNVNSYLS